VEKAGGQNDTENEYEDYEAVNGLEEMYETMDERVEKYEAMNEVQEEEEEYVVLSWY